MAKRRNNRAIVRATAPMRDSLASFTASAAASAFAGGYRDSPFHGLVEGLGGYDALYNTSWLCRAAIDAIPEDCFKRGYQWVAEADQISLLDKEESKHQIKKKKRQALAYSRRYGEAYIYFDTGQSPSEELRIDAVKKGGLRFVNVLRTLDLQKGEIERDPVSPYFGQPKFYTVNTTQIHPSRICRFVNNEDPNTNTGVPVLQYMLGPIVSAETARDNTVALTTEALIDIMKVKGLMDGVQDPVSEAAILRRYELFRMGKATNKLGVIDMDNEDYQRHPSQFTTLPDIIQSMRREVSAAIGIPYSLLFGREGGIGSNGDVELKNYYDNIATMQSNDIEPVCALLDECVIRSALGNRPEEIYLDWLSLYEMSDKEKAEVAKVNAEAVKTAVESGAIPAQMMTESLVNSWVESGSFPGVEQQYAEWASGGGWEAEEPEETDVIRANPAEEDEQGSLLDWARDELINR